MGLVVVGSVAFDSIVTPKSREDDALGGSAVHFSLSSCFQAKTKLVGVVGEDFPADRKKLLSDRGVDLEGLEVVAGGRTFRWEGKYFDNMNQRETLSVELNVFEHFQPRLPGSYRDARYVFLANGSPDTQSSVLDQVQGKPFVMADTMDLWIQTAHAPLEKLLRRLDGLVLNDEEAALLSGDDGLISSGRAIRSRYELRYLVIKKGEHGCIIFHEGGEIALPAWPLKDVVDPTGAGDSFAGGVMGYLAKVKSVDLEHFKKAVAWGTVMASFCCENFGVRRMVDLTLVEAEQRYHQFRSMLTLNG